jgi:hypothetical protein
MNLLIIIGLWAFLNAFQIVYLVMSNQIHDAIMILLITSIAAVFTYQFRKGYDA